MAPRKPHTNGSSLPSFDLVKGAAIGRWADIAQQVFGLSSAFLTGEHTECPKCGGKDRFRVFDDFAQTGGAICNQCARDLGDGFKLGDWFLGTPKAETLAQVATFLGVTANGSQSHSRLSADPAEHLAWLPWNEALVGLWCLSKPPIIPAALRRCGAKLARYRDKYTVIALPVWGEKLTAAAPVGWCIYNITGGTLPKFTKIAGDKPKIEQVKVKLTYGTRQGLIGPLDELAAASHVWKLEGPSDLLAWLSLDNIATGHIAVTNSSGAGEHPLQWIVSLFAGKIVYTLHDADLPGEKGSTGWTDERGSWHPGWASEGARHASESRLVKLPYAVAADHGRDLRDWCTESSPDMPPRSFVDLLELAADAEIVEPPAGEPDPDDAANIKPNEAIDDPHRLARANLERYAAITGGGKIRYWREEWFVYKHNRYRRLGTKEFSAKVAGSIKEEFNRANIEDQRRWEEKRQADPDHDEPRPEARKVTKTLVSNVVQATTSTQILSAEVELNSLIDGTGRRSGSRARNWIAMANGIVDVDAFLNDRELDEVLLPHTSDWFSTVCLPYNFDPDATCPRWEAFLDRCMEGDQDLIAVLQEWAGYLLLPDTSQQKFVINEGEGGNGKSVYIAGVQALLGEDNCSAVPLDKFSGQFDLTETLGKLANICGDMGEIDKIGEGHLKSFVSGDRMLFSRKNLSGINTTPTARLMFNTNNRPRFGDKSSGIWRRLLLIPWNVTIAATERVLGMDKVAWWQASGELPGMLLWAVRGLHRLRMQKAFTYSEKIEEGLNSYRREVNPAREFLLEHLEPHPTTAVRTKSLYDLYRKWTDQNGNQPMAATVFGREVFRAFPEVVRERSPGGDRHWRYTGLRWTQTYVCGDKPDEYPLFEQTSF